MDACLEMTSNDLIKRLLVEDSPGPLLINPKQVSPDLKDALKPTLRKVCKSLKLAIPNYNASRIARSDLHDKDPEKANLYWMPYAISYMGRQEVSACCGTYLADLRKDIISATFCGFYDELLLKMRGVRLQLNSKTHTVEQLKHIAYNVERLLEEPVALSINNIVYDWDWSIEE